MTDQSAHFRASIPANYDSGLGPHLFVDFAADLAHRAAAANPRSVLEIAAGTGVVTRELIRTLPDSVAITATDLSQPMLDRAQSHPGSERIRWQQADALALPFEDSSFDVIVCQFGVMFFADKRAAFREALRVLKSGGRFLFEVWDRREEIVIQYTEAKSLVERCR